jgi:Domain of Unknown Function (DUF1080)
VPSAFRDTRNQATFSGDFGFRVAIMVPKPADPQSASPSEPSERFLTAQRVTSTPPTAKAVEIGATRETAVASRGPFPGTSTFGGAWKLERGDLVQSDTVHRATLIFGEPGWQDFDLTVQVQKTQGNDDVGVVFRWQNEDQYRRFIIGGDGNTAADLASVSNGKLERTNGNVKQYKMAADRWYSMKIQVRGNVCRCLLEGKLYFDHADPRFSFGKVGLLTSHTAARFRNLKISDSAGKVLWKGIPAVEKGKD